MSEQPYENDEIFAEMRTNDMYDGMRYASKRVMDMVRQQGKNTLEGCLVVMFWGDSVSASWKEDDRDK